MTESTEPTIDKLRIALAQVTPCPGDLVANLETAEEQAQLAADHGADLLIFPEMLLSGYAVGRTRLEELAEYDDGPSSRHIAELAQTYRLGIIYGYPEKTAEQELFNSVNFLDAAGQLLLKYRKLHFFGEVDHAQFDRSSALPTTVSWQGWSVSLAICYDVEFPELVRSAALAGADLLCVPTANMTDYDHVPDLLVPARAVENQIYIAYANYVGSDQKFQYGGRSVVVGPGGEALAQAGREPELLTADLRRDQLLASREANPYLNDRRDDLFPG